MKNMNFIINYIVLILLLLSFKGCPFGEPTGDSTLTIVNNSNKTLLFFIHIDSNIVIEKTNFSLNPHSLIKQYSWWKETLNKYPIQRLFLFDKTVTDSVPWDTIKKYNMYLKRIDFDLKYLDSTNWTLTYP
ncbi:MAG: hypothetical protein NT007_16330 [Candidatus Kapabacteria bacterium]|nr:hypothetical protein [Candidatus Kapabacteria bacterium]